MNTHNKRLTILSAEEKFALYALPDFNESQQYEYFTFTNEEQKIILKFRSKKNRISNRKLSSGSVPF